MITPCLPFDEARLKKDAVFSINVNKHIKKSGILSVITTDLFARGEIQHSNYRLAPKYPCPAAIEDICHAYHWVTNHAKQYNGVFLGYI